MDWFVPTAKLLRECAGLFAAGFALNKVRNQVCGAISDNNRHGRNENSPHCRCKKRGLERWNFWFIAGLRFATSVVMTRLLAPELFGIMVIFNSLKAGIELLTDVGIGQSIIYNRNAETSDFYNTAWTLAAIHGIIMGHRVCRDGACRLLLSNANFIFGHTGRGFYSCDLGIWVTQWRSRTKTSEHSKTDNI